VGLAAAAALASSCAYYNTFYLARKYYFKATSGAPYEVDRQGSVQASNYTHSIDYSKKVIAQYPKSKWVDDAYLLWAEALVGRDDPLQTITMLQDFAGKFPKSEQRATATFFLGLAYRNARRYRQAVDTFDDFLKQAPRDALVPYAHLERARALSSLGRYGESADAAGVIVDHYPKHDLLDRALRQRAESRLQDGNYDGARADFHEIGSRATSDQERFDFIMREADCLEAARTYDAELALLHAELAHTPPPPPPANSASGPVTSATGPSDTRGTSTVVPAGATIPTNTPGAGVAAGNPSTERYGRLTMRIGTVNLLAGRVKESLAQYQNVIKDYPKSALSAEAQYRIGYACETGSEDFDRALQEYGKVKEQYGLTLYTQQAQQRSDDLNRIMQFRHGGGGADSLEKKAEAGFLTAERYLFELKHPDRAAEEYANVAKQYPGTAAAGRALNAQAWVLERKLDRPAAADSIYWKVVHEYPATEAQMAARDYLEGDGIVVADSLIVPPKPPAPTAADSARALTPIPGKTPALGAGGAGLFGRPDSLGGRGIAQFPSLGARRDSLGRMVFPGPGGMPPGMGLGAPPDSLARPRGLFAPAPPAPSPAPAPAPSPAPADSTRGPSPSPAPPSSVSTPAPGPAPPPAPAPSAGPPPAAPAPADTTHAVAPPSPPVAPPPVPAPGPQPAAPAPADTTRAPAAPVPAPTDTTHHGGTR